MTVWPPHNAARYAFIPAEGKAVLITEHGVRRLSGFPYEDALLA